MNTCIIRLIVFIMCYLPVVASAAVERHALIIGNSDYLKSELLNPKNDAKDMAAQLSSMGYKIHSGGPALDLDRVGMERTIRAFAQQLPEKAHALFYFAGHGVATLPDAFRTPENYLLPLNHNLEDEAQLPDRAVNVRRVVEILKIANPEGINVVLLDACRDNPLRSSLRSVKKGLERLSNLPRGVFVGYAADSGQVAADGDGRNGTYTAELLNVLREQPNVIVEVAHKNVAKRVFEKTNGKQFPVAENKVYGDWCFGVCGDAPVQTVASVTLKEPPAKAPVKKPVAAPQEGAAEMVVKADDKKRWMIIGGVAAAVLGVALLSGGDSADPETFTLQLTPP